MADRQLRLAAIAFSAVVLVSVVSACGDDSTATGSDSASSTTVPMSATTFSIEVVDNSGAMAVQESQLGEDRLLHVTFPPDNERGRAFTLATREGELWSDRYQLLQSLDASRAQWYPIDARRAVNDQGKVGPGPDELLLPPDMAAGTWRICTVNAVDDACVTFELR